MKHNVLAPSVGESITEVSILKWAKKDGEYVKTGEKILEIESDKATVEIVAEANGKLSVLKPEGQTVPIGEVIGLIDDSATASASPSAAAPSAPAPAAVKPASAPAPQAAPAASAGMSMNPHLSPAARKHSVERGVDPSQVSGTGKDGRVTKGDVLQHQPSAAPAAAAPALAPTPKGPTMKDGPGDRRVPMSRIRIRIAERLVQAQHTAAILTTFNEVDLTKVIEVRTKYKDKFKAKHGVPLSFMSFFTRASIEVLKQIEAVNATIDGTDIVYHDYQDIGIAVGTDRGLVVPVLRNASEMTFVDIEKKTAELAVKGRDGKLSIAEMTGGTFTISNGGVYGSMLSTPILNPPQSAILGMHNIIERPMAVNGKVEIRPMMYLALSYDHRIIDGKEAVTFLVQLKDLLENPEKLRLDFTNGL